MTAYRKTMMRFKSPYGFYTYKEDYLRDFKNINRIESMDDDLFLEAITIHNRVVYLDTTKNLGTIVKHSRIRDALTVFMTYFVKITNWFMK